MDKIILGTSKRGLFGYDSTNDHIRLQNNDDGGDSIRILAPSVFDYILSRKDRDTGWFHLVVACDTTDGTAGDRVKIYHNGVRQTDFYSSSNPSPNADTGFNQGGSSLGRGGTGSDTSYVDASLVMFIGLMDYNLDLKTLDSLIHSQELGDLKNILVVLMHQQVDLEVLFGVVM